MGDCGPVLSGDVVTKLNIAKDETDRSPNDIQLKEAREALEKIQRKKSLLNYWILI